MQQQVRPKRLLFMACFSVLALFIALVSCADKNNPAVPLTGPKLTISLDSTLDDSSGTILATSITGATMTDSAGTLIKTAQISDSKANFYIEDLYPDDYFITINGLTQERVPTRIIAIQDTIYDMTQVVGKKLCTSLILSGNDTIFMIKTFFRGQEGHPVRQYSDGVNLLPEEYAYIIQSMGAGMGNFEVRVDSTAGLLMREPNPRHSPHQFGSWIAGEANHGKALLNNPDLITSQCQGMGCHNNYDTKPLQWHDISPMIGYCFKCHYGSAGISAGMVDPAH